MVNQKYIEEMPYPIAGVYARVYDETLPWMARREGLYFTVYQLMRTVGLTLIGQYLTGPAPDPSNEPLRKYRDRLNRAIRGIRCPHYNDWMTLMGTLRKYGGKLGLDFFPDCYDAIKHAQRHKVKIPSEYGLEYGRRYEDVNLWEAFLALRNGCAHSGASHEAVCRRDVEWYTPFLEELMAVFSFLCDYDLLVLRSSLDQDPPLVQCLKGLNPNPHEELELDNDLEDAFGESPVVFRSADGRVQPLFPLFHGHIEGEPIHFYDGHYLLDRERLQRRTIYYLGIHKRLPIDDTEASNVIHPLAPPDAGEQLKRMLERHDIPWHIERKEIAPWTIRDFVNDYTRRTYDDLIGIKYIPAVYLDRPGWSRPLWSFLTKEHTPYRAFLIAGPAGCGKTALLCDMTRRFLECIDKGECDDLVFFIRGDGLLDESVIGHEVTNRVLWNVLHKIGIRPAEFKDWAEFLNFLSQKRRDDRVEGRLFILMFDAINEARNPERILEELLELVKVAKEHPWLRIVMTMRSEFLAVWRGRASGNEKNPFYSVSHLFYSPAEDLHPNRRPEDPPAWVLPRFTVDEARTVYERYQERALASAEASSQEDAEKSAPTPSLAGIVACRTPWAELPDIVRHDILTIPLHIHIWMHTFKDRYAPAIASTAELFSAYIADLRKQYIAFWEGMKIILEYMLEQGKMELDDYDAHTIHEEWWKTIPSYERQHRYPPIETACIAGVMQKRSREEGGGYRIPYQALREQLLFAYFMEEDQALSTDSIKKWLAYPETQDLEGALTLIAYELWTQNRPHDLVLFLTHEESDVQYLYQLLGIPTVGVRILERCFALILERTIDIEQFEERFKIFLKNIPAIEHIRKTITELVLYDVYNRIETLPRTQVLFRFLTTFHPFLEQWSNEYKDAFWSRELAVLSARLGDMFQRIGNLDQARAYYEKFLELAETLHVQDRTNTQWTRDLSVSYDRMGDLLVKMEKFDQAGVYYEKSLELAETLHNQDPDNAKWIHDLSISYNKMGDIMARMGDLNKAWEYYEKSLELAETLHDQDPTNARWTHALSVSYITMGDLLTSTGNLNQARAYYEKALELRETLHDQDPTNAQWTRDLGVSYERMGHILASMSNLNRARAYYEKAIELREALHDQDPTNTQWTRDLSVSYITMGDLLTSTGNLNQARAYYEKAIEFFKALHAQDPTNAQWTRDLSASYVRMGDILARMDSLDQARAYYEKAIELREALHDQDPTNADLTYDLSVSYERMGDILASMGNLDRARSYYEKALKLFEILHDQDPTNAQWTHDLSVSYERMGDILASMGNLDQARVYYEKALELREALHDQDPTNAQWTRDLSVSYGTMGDILASMGNLDQARAYHEEALELAETLHDQDPTNAQWTRDLYFSQIRFGYGELLQGQFDDAMAWMEKALQLMDNLCRISPEHGLWQWDVAYIRSWMGLVRLLQRQFPHARTQFTEAETKFEQLSESFGDDASFLYDWMRTTTWSAFLMLLLRKPALAESFLIQSKTYCERVSAETSSDIDWQILACFVHIGEALLQPNPTQLENTLAKLKHIYETKYLPYDELILMDRLLTLLADEDCIPSSVRPSFSHLHTFIHQTLSHIQNRTPSQPTPPNTS